MSKPIIITIDPLFSHPDAVPMAAVIDHEAGTFEILSDED